MNLGGYKMKRKMMSLMFFVMLTMLTACTNKDVTYHNYTYEGENEKWTADFKVNGKTIFTRTNGVLSAKNDVSQVLTITYRGDLSELSTVRNLKIIYKTSAGGASISNNYDEDYSITNKTFTLKSGGKNGAIPNEDETIKVTVDTDGSQQMLELKKPE